MTTSMSHQRPSDSENNPDFFLPDPRNRDNTLPPPQPQDRSDDAINLSVLQRYLPSAEYIEEKAPYAVVYIYGAGGEGKEPGWEKTGVEGTVFVLRLLNDEGEYEYAVLVLNRRGLDNFVLHLERKEGVELTEEYIILQGTVQDEGKVYGLWIFEEQGSSTKEKRGEIGKCIVKCVEMAEGKTQDGDENDQVQVQVQQYGQENGSNGQRQPQMAIGSPDLMAILNPPRAHASQPPDSSQEGNILDKFFWNAGDKAQ